MSQYPKTCSCSKQELLTTSNTSLDLKFHNLAKGKNILSQVASWLRENGFMPAKANIICSVCTSWAYGESGYGGTIRNRENCEEEGSSPEKDMEVDFEHFEPLTENETSAVSDLCGHLGDYLRLVILQDLKHGAHA